MLPRMMNAEIFYATLASSGFNDFTLAAQKFLPEARRLILKSILDKAQIIFSEKIKAMDTITIMPTPITLLGQTHNSESDYRSAFRVALSVGTRRQSLVLEANGEVHPKLDSVKIFDAGCGENNSNVANVVTEYELYSNSIGTKDPSTKLVVRYDPHLKEAERSLIIGMFIANLVAVYPGKPITVIIGENHLQDIVNSTEYFLQTTPAAKTAQFTLAPSKAIHISHKPTLFLGLDSSALSNLEKVMFHLVEHYEISREKLRGILADKYKHNSSLKYGDFIDILNNLEDTLDSKKHSPKLFNQNLVPDIEINDLETQSDFQRKIF